MNLLTASPPSVFDRDGGCGQAKNDGRQREAIFVPAALLLGGRTPGVAAAFATPAALALIFVPADFGTYTQLFLIAATLYGVGQLGMAESLLYFLPRDPGRAARYALNALLALMAGGVACLLGLSLWGEEIAGWMGNPNLAGYTTPLGVYLLLLLTSAGLETVMMARKRYGRTAATYVALDLARAALLIVPAVLGGSLAWLMRGAIAFATLRCLTALWSLRTEFGATLAPSRELLGRQLTYALPFQLAAGVEIVQAKLHQYVVAHQVDAATFAAYAVGCLDIPIAEFAVGAVVNVLMVTMAEHRRDGQDGAALALWREATRKLALLFFPVAVGLMATAPSLIAALFTQQYRAGVPVFAVLSAALLFPALAVDGVLRVYAQTRYLLVLHIIGLLATVLMIGPFIAAFGLVGAAAATVMAAGVPRALGLARMCRLTGLPLADLLPWRSLGGPLLAAIWAAAPAAAIGVALEAWPLAALAVAGIIYAIAYVVALRGLGVLSEVDRAAVRAWLAFRPAAAR